MLNIGNAISAISMGRRGFRGAVGVLLLVGALLAPPLAGATESGEAYPALTEPAHPWHYDTRLIFGLTRGLSQMSFDVDGRGVGLFLALPIDLIELPVTIFSGSASSEVFGITRGTRPMNYTPLLQGLGSLFTVPLDVVALPAALLGGLQGE